MTINRSKQDDFQYVVTVASKVIGCDLPSLDTIFHEPVLRKSKTIMDDTSHSDHSFFDLLPSDERLKSHIACTARFRKVFILPLNVL